MRILYIIDSLGTGGAERSTSYLWYLLREQGVAIKIICLRRRKEGIQTEILQENFDVMFLQSVSWLTHARQLVNIIKEWQPDIVHSILWKSNIRARVARFLHRFYHVESLVNLVYADTRIQDVGRLKLSVYRWLDQYTGQWGVDHFHANGESVANHYTSKLSIPRDKMTIVKRGRFPNPFVNRKGKLRQEFNRKYSIVDGEIILMNVGRQEYQKGHDILLNALGKIKKGNGLKFRLFIAGRDGNASAKILTSIKHHGLEREVILLGHYGNIPELLVCGDIFVFPSRFEGFPGALIEAEAAGLPIICTDLPMMLEVAIPGSNCLVFPNENETQLAEAILKLATNRNLMTEYSRNSIAQFNANFLIPVINEQMHSMYQRLIYSGR